MFNECLISDKDTAKLYVCRFPVQCCVWVAREKVVACRGLAVSMVIIAFQEVVSGGTETTPG